MSLILPRHAGVD